MKTKFYVALIVMLNLGCKASCKPYIPPPWGFFAHKLINRLAVFTLPPEMAGFYKKHLDYLAEHAVDPDKRRYSSKHEAPRHYIDLDAYGKPPFDSLPRNWLDALVKYTDIYAVNDKGDTSLFVNHQNISLEQKDLVFYLNDLRLKTMKDTMRVSRKLYGDFYFRNILPNRYEDSQAFSADSLKLIFPLISDVNKVFAAEQLSHHGILPYHLQQMEKRLTDAFRKIDKSKILQLSAEIGHYLGDAHVPLHTTQNYNGQLTGQHGIHGFWESRLPELLSGEYDFWVGPATYVPNTENLYWQIVTDSHGLVDSLLFSERELRRIFPADRISCVEERQGANVLTPCEEFARAYHDRLNGMVEYRMRAAILAIGSVWMTAWVNAGQPALGKFDEGNSDPSDVAPKAENHSVEHTIMLGRPE